MESVIYRDLGKIDYKEGWTVQQTIFEALTAAKTAGNKPGNPGTEQVVLHPVIPGAGIEPAPQQTLLLCEHPHVYTLGRSGHEDNLLVNPGFLERIGATYHRIDRGGDITYHGPGQLVGYPILDLDRLGFGLKDYVHALEESVIRTLAEFGVPAGRSDGATGVWIGTGAVGENGAGEGPLRKICAIGVRSARFVTMHGFALNVNTQLEYFSYINPCGFTDRGVTSLEKETGHPVDITAVKSAYVRHFEQIMNVKIIIKNNDYANSKTMGSQGAGGSR